MANALRRAGMAAMYVFLFAASLVSLFPFYWMVVCSTNSAVQINQGKAFFGNELFNNLAKLFDPKLGYLLAIKNSLVIALLTTAIALVIASMAGYGFEIFRTKWRDRLFNLLLVSMMIPFCALMIPLYRMFGGFAAKGPLKFIALDTLPAVIIPVLSTAFLVFFFRQNTKSFPREILDSGRMDGLSEPGIFFRIYMPVMRSTYAAGAIITFLASWNNYLWPLVSLHSPEKRTIPLVLSAMGSSYTPDYGMIMAGIVIATLPTALIFFLMQKHFVAGMIGAVK